MKLQPFVKTRGSVPSPSGARNVAHHHPEHGANAALARDLGDDVRVLVHVREAGDPAEQHFGDREPGAVRDEFGCRANVLRRRATRSSARFDGRSLARPRSNALRGVRVRVHEAGEQDVLRPVVMRTPRRRFGPPPRPAARRRFARRRRRPRVAPRRTLAARRERSSGDESERRHVASDGGFFASAKGGPV